MPRSTPTDLLDDLRNDAATPLAAPADENAESGLKFETAVAELEQIVQNMETGNLSLEDSITAYRRGSELLKHCQQQLSSAERKIQILEEGSLRELSDFDAASGDDK
ncbi:MAG: exodeoxyribonuclease VII small subunit [Propionivibrio sp.]